MDYLAGIKTGHLPDNAPSNILQIFYLDYVEESYCDAKMTRMYQLNMPKIEKLLENSIERKNRMHWNEDTARIDHEIWVLNKFGSVLRDSGPYYSQNTNELTVYEWKLQSSVVDAFIFSKIHFQHVTVIIENKMEHWFGIKTSSDPAYIYRRSRQRPRALLKVECHLLPQSPIVLAANNPKYKSRCNICGVCNQIIYPMETYFFKKTCTYLAEKEKEIELGEECVEG